MKYIIWMMDIKNNIEMYREDDSNYPIEIASKNLKDNPNCADYKIYIPKEEYDYQKEQNAIKSQKIALAIRELQKNYNSLEEIF